MQLAYREFGQGQPLIILHGLFGQSDNWNTLAKRFAENGFHVFTVDQRNHGLSPHSDEWTYELMAHDLKEFIDFHKLQNPILLGHSMGGKTLLFFENLYPEVSKKNVIVDIAPRAYEPHHSDVLEALNAVDFTEINTRKDAEAIMSKYITDFGTKQFLLKNIYWKEDETKQMAWRFNLSVITNLIAEISIVTPFYTSNKPSLFLRGEKSNYITDADCADIKNRFLNAQVETIANCGHWIHAEQPNLFFEAVSKFIEL